MKRLSQSGSSNFCLELRKNALLISQSHFSNFALHMINAEIVLHYVAEQSRADECETTQGAQGKVKQAKCRIGKRNAPLLSKLLPSSFAILDST